METQVIERTLFPEQLERGPAGLPSPGWLEPVMPAAVSVKVSDTVPALGRMLERQRLEREEASRRDAHPATSAVAAAMETAAFIGD